jgi:branched-chain amino acid transport system substrate-binding protein
MKANRFVRRSFLKHAAAGVATAAAIKVVARSRNLAQAAAGGAAKIKVGFMLPYTGTYAPLGAAIENGFRLALQEGGGKLGGREVEIAKVDDESEPAKATDNVNRLLTRDKVDVVVGTVHSGVAAAMIHVTKGAGVLHIIPNAGLAAATGPLCAPNIFRTSFSNWQSGFAMGTVLAGRKAIRKVVTLSWKYAAGEDFVKGFRDGYAKGGGQIAKQLWLPFPNVEFQALLTEIASLKPDATYAFFAGAGAAKFLRDYAQAGLKEKIPLVGPGFLTEGVIAPAGAAAQGIETCLHYADGLGTKRDDAFRAAYAKAFKSEPDVYAVAGYDAGLLLDAGLRAAKGDVGNLGRQKEIISAMEKATIDSPRGKWRLSRAHNPVQDIYLRKVVGTQNKYVSVAVKGLDDDPAMMSACKMA